MKDPVMLSGGDLGGERVEGEGWEVGEERQFGNLIYRRISSDLTPDTDDQAVFCGLAG